MKISEIQQAMAAYYNWVTSTGYDEIDVVLIRQVIKRCAELEKENEELQEKLKTSNQLRVIAENELKKQEQGKEDTDSSLYMKTIKRMKRLGFDENDNKKIILMLSTEIECYRNKIGWLEKALKEAMEWQHD
ncbi:hypothetical protein [Holdemania massiliensis]|uniref:hypothetical protein n=1 Tax=Holdemania massiliensis TaxID=1468449 RepID=UPI0024332EDF|nr:hypothetical protein [Holdemania massiliensis]